MCKDGIVHWDVVVLWQEVRTVGVDCLCNDCKKVIWNSERERALESQKYHWTRNSPASSDPAKNPKCVCDMSGQAFFFVFCRCQIVLY